MSMTDTIADMLTRIRNGQKTKLLFVPVPHSRAKCDILNVLQEEGYISGYTVSDVRKGIKQIDVKLKYSANGMPTIKEITRVSKPGKRTYTAISDLGGYYNGMGIYVLSTSQGIVSDRSARQKGIGGEVICKVF
jgi:small subunit ribosomal protein S8